MSVVILKDFFLSQALGTLNAQIALSIETGHATGMLRSFLMKKVMGTLVLKTPDAGDTLLCGMARGDATITEIKAAIEMAQVERSMQNQADVRVVLHETLLVIVGKETDRTETVEIEKSLGGGNGIPFEEGDGWQWFTYNLNSSNLVAGSNLTGEFTYYGVWLN